MCGDLLAKLMIETGMVQNSLQNVQTALNI